jgi:hypothetical protein
VAQNGGLTGSSVEDAEMADAEGDDSLDEDDMMDKISSSPSIDDGGYSLLRSWPLRYDSLSLRTSGSSSPGGGVMVASSSPYVDQPEFLPLNFLSQDPEQESFQRSVPHRLAHGELQVSVDSLTTNPGFLEDEDSHDVIEPDQIECYDDDYESCDSSDPFAVQFGFDMDDSSDDSSDDGYEEEDDDLCFPCESSDEGDDDDFPFPEDPRFIDSGWSGECLQDTEDIDFEFVYALHTFVATVEGQANATKGDTMVLLDDSNSYWWLVRVVKDSSIGMLFCCSLLLRPLTVSRLLTRRTYRNPYRTLGKTEQA